MIYKDYYIWTLQGWIKASELKNSDEIKIFDAKNRVFSFKKVSNITKKIIDKNYMLYNDNYEFIFSDTSSFLNQDNQVVNIKDCKNIMIDEKTLWANFKIKQINKNTEYITFDLDKYDFVLIKNVLSIYFNFSFEIFDNVGNNMLNNKEVNYAKPTRVRKVNK